MVLYKKGGAFLKILIVCNSSIGLEKFRGMLIQSLIKRKNSIVTIVPLLDDPEEKNAQKKLMALDCTVIRVPIKRRGINPLTDAKLFSKYYRFIKREKPDLVLTYTIKPNIYGGIACRILKVPYAVNITGLGTAFQGNSILKHVITMMYKVALKKVKIVFFENVENRNIFVDFGIVSKEKTHVLAGAGVDLEHFSYMDYPTDTDNTRFLFVGRVMQEKGIDELFCVMRRLYKNGYKCSLDILGGFEENYSEKIQQYEAEGWLHYRGFQNDIRPFVKNTHCLVLPSWHEGMANTNLECAAMGRPIITSNIHGCLEAVDDGISGFLCGKKDRESLYLKMKEFIEMPFGDKEVMGIVGRKRMESLFDKKVVVEATINELMKGRM